MESIFSFITLKKDTHYLESDSTIRQVLEKFDVHKFSVVPLLDANGKYVTSISEGDILRFIKNDCNFNMEKAENKSINCVPVYRPYKALPIDCSKKEVLDLSLEQNFIPVVDDRGIYIGIIKRKAVLEYLFKGSELKNNI